MITTLPVSRSIRGIDLLLEEGLNIKVLLLPDGDDPDSFARKHNASDFIEFVETNSSDFIHFKTNLLLKKMRATTLSSGPALSAILYAVFLLFPIQLL